MKNSKTPPKALYRAVALGLILALILIGLTPQINFLGDSLRTIWQADMVFLAWAVAAIMLSYFTAALTYYFLASVNLRFWPTLLVQVADGFTNRLLPASIGGVATNLLYLIKQHHTKTKAGFVIAINSVLGFVGHFIFLSILLITSSTSLHKVFIWRFPTKFILWLVLFCLIATLYLVFILRIRRLANKVLANLLGMIKYALARPVKLSQALVFSMTTTISYFLVLYFSMLAVNVHVSLLQTFLALSIGVFAISVTPTPGGIGGAEAGLTAGLSSMGVPPHQALSVALVYRFATFWLPIVPGFVALQTALHRRYIKTIRIYFA